MARLRIGFRHLCEYQLGPPLTGRCRRSECRAAITDSTKPMDLLDINPLSASGSAWRRRPSRAGSICESLSTMRACPIDWPPRPLRRAFLRLAFAAQ
jgi:hypothetical protein